MMYQKIQHLLANKKEKSNVSLSDVLLVKAPIPLKQTIAPIPPTKEELLAKLDNKDEQKDEKEQKEEKEKEKKSELLEKKIKNHKILPKTIK